MLPPTGELIEPVHPRYIRRHSLSGKVSCAMALCGLLFWIIGIIAHRQTGSIALAVLVIAWPAMFSFTLIGLALAIHGVIPRRRRKIYPLLGLLFNPLILLLFLIHFLWPTPDSLVLAAMDEDMASVDRAMLLGVPIRSVSLLDHEGVKAGATALTAAAQMGKYEVVQQLLARKADVNQPDEAGVTPLEHAVAASHSDVAQLLLEHNADPNHQGPQGQALTIAARQGHQIMLEMLIAHGAKVNAAGVSPLHEAARLGHNGIARLLIDAKADVQHPDDQGRTPLHHAAANGHIHMVRLLIASGADINAKDQRKITPLQLALENDHLEIQKVLLSGKANVDIFTAIVMNDRGRVKDILLNDPQAIGKLHRGRTPLHEAVRLDNLDMVKMLLEHQADLQAVTEDEVALTPLQLAVMEGHVEIATLLVERKADVNRIIRTPEVVAPPLYFAVISGQEAMVSLLLEHGADVNALCETPDATARPLLFAVARNDLPVINLLLEHNADIDGRKNDTSPTPLYEAVKRGYIDVVALLFNKGANPGWTVGESTPLALAEARSNHDPLVYDRIVNILTGEVKVTTPVVR